MSHVTQAAAPKFRCLKRIIDIVVAITGLILLFPVFVVVAVGIFITMGRPVLFCHPRPGLYCKTFTLYKFRTMRDACDQQGQPLPDAARISPLGWFLRYTSLDELPQLWNVLKGDMSLVGPRPLLIEDLPFYTPDELRRHHVRPGITGLAQVHGRNAISCDAKLQHDLWYVDHWSLLVDIAIIALTLVCVFRGTGVAGPGEATVSMLRSQPTPPAISETEA